MSNLQRIIVSYLDRDMVSARELREVMSVTSSLDSWIQARIKKFHFIENQDYFVISPTELSKKDYNLEYRAALEIASIEKRGAEVAEFIEAKMNERREALSGNKAGDIFHFLFVICEGKKLIDCEALYKFMNLDTNNYRKDVSDCLALMHLKEGLDYHVSYDGYMLEVNAAVDIVSVKASTSLITLDLRNTIFHSIGFCIYKWVVEGEQLGLRVFRHNHINDVAKKLEKWERYRMTKASLAPTAEKIGVKLEHLMAFSRRKDEPNHPCADVLKRNLDNHVEKYGAMLVYNDGKEMIDAKVLQVNMDQEMGIAQWMKIKIKSLSLVEGKDYIIATNGKTYHLELSTAIDIVKHKRYREGESFLYRDTDAYKLMNFLTRRLALQNRLIEKE